jgi:hypothetical protein
MVVQVQTIETLLRDCPLPHRLMQIDLAREADISSRRLRFLLFFVKFKLAI